MDYREKMKIKMIYRDRSYYAYQAGKYLKDQLNGKDKFLFLILSRFFIKNLYWIILIKE